MAYNRKNILLRIIDIQTIYLQHNEQGVTGEYIYNRYIHPVYRISRKTFYNYLATNAKKELKELEQKIIKHKENQLQLEI
jgi:hypothetical protein